LKKGSLSTLLDEPQGRDSHMVMEVSEEQECFLWLAGVGGH